MSLTFEDVKRAVKEALAEANGGSDDVVVPPDVMVMREDGTVKVPALVAMKREYFTSGEKDAVAFSEFIPEYVFCEEALTGDWFPNITAEQYTNISYNTNRARMTGGFLAAEDYTGTASTYTKRWPWSKPEPTKHIPDAASLPGTNLSVPAVGFKDVVPLFTRLFERYKATQHVPHWKVGPGLTYY
jgi:hypothetical protein